MHREADDPGRGLVHRGADLHNCKESKVSGTISMTWKSRVMLFLVPDKKIILKQHVGKISVAVQKTTVAEYFA